MAKASRHGGLHRRIAAIILKCGESRVWVDPSALARVDRAITRSDLRRLIKDGVISRKPEKINTPTLHGRQGTGSRKGAKGGRQAKKANWLKIIRPQRKMLNELKKDLTETSYRKLYGMVKGNSFRSKSHLQSYIQEKGLMKKK